MKDSLCYWRLEIAFNGTGFVGWQSQPCGNTVQQTLEAKLNRIYNTLAGNPIKVTGSGRTDAGVHACGMTVSFAAPLNPVISGLGLKHGLNSLLFNYGIVVIEVKETSKEFSARFSANAKAYTYVINRSSFRSPFTSTLSLEEPKCIADKEMRKAAGYLVGKHDFSSFAVAINKTGKNPVREIYKIDIDIYAEFVCLTFVGNSFLYKMVRSLVGTLLAVGTKKISAERVRTILEARDRAAAMKTAPAQGLYLMKVFYEKEEWKSFKVERLPFCY